MTERKENLDSVPAQSGACLDENQDLPE